MSWPGLALAALVVLAIGLGLWATGGPGQGRIEQRNQTRQDDLYRLSAHVHCLAALADNALPEVIELSDRCPGNLRLADPFTSEDYRYERLSETAFRVCATFEPQRNATFARMPDFDPDTGCIHYRSSPR